MLRPRPGPSTVRWRRFDPSTRQRVIETAFAFEEIQWLVNTSAYGGDPDTVCTGFGGRVRRPAYIQGKAGQQVRGIPYCWGCFGTLEVIRNKIEHGVLAGNICTRNEPRADTAGVDCSAFVSATWGLSTHFTTSAIPTITQPVTDPSDLRPGDAFNKPGSHVMLFLRFTPSRMVEVMKSSPGNCPGRVCRNVYPLASILARGYQPVRFSALVNDTSTVAEISPRPRRWNPRRRRRRSTERGPNTERYSRPTDHTPNWCNSKASLMAWSGVIDLRGSKLGFRFFKCSVSPAGPPAYCSTGEKERSGSGIAMQSKFWISSCLSAFVAATFGSVRAEPAPSGNGSLRSADGGSVRALIIGIDAYRHVKPLKGAVADARDIEQSP